MLRNNGQCLEKLLPLCHSVPYWQRQSLKEPVTHWHQAAWAHLYCTDIVALVLHQGVSTESFVTSDIVGSSVMPTFKSIQWWTVPLIKLVKGRADIFVILPRLLFCILYSTSFFSTCQCFGTQASIFSCGLDLTRAKIKSFILFISSLCKKLLCIDFCRNSNCIFFRNCVRHGEAN